LANFQIFGKILKQNLHFLRNDKNILLNSHKIHWSLTLPYPWAIVSVLKCFKPLVTPFMLGPLPWPRSRCSVYGRQVMVWM